MKGVSSAVARLSRMPGEARSAALRAAMEAARETQRLARAAVPVRSGALRSSITAAAADEGARAFTSLPYAGAVEMGSLLCAPRPFLRPAAEKAQFAKRACQRIQEVLR